MASIAIAGVVAIVLGGLAVGSHTGDPSKRRAAVEAYQARLLPLAQEWGRIEVQGMRPAINDLETGQGVPPETVVAEAQAWRAGFESLRARIAALSAPKGLEKAQRLFDQAMVYYLASAKAFEAAAGGPTGQRADGIKRGINEAQKGARLYNEASLVLQAVRKDVGLPPTDDFPNHKAGREDVSEDVNGS